MEMIASHYDDSQVLRARGLRVTSPRLCILAVLRGHHGHCTAEEISDEVRLHLPAVNVATVYRALHDLREAGLITETDVGQKSTMYELLDERHHHIVCESCRGVAAIDDAIVEPIKTSLYSRYGFQARMDHFAFFGLCKECAAARDGS
mgnify:CR=1 FL=1